MGGVVNAENWMFSISLLGSYDRNILIEFSWSDSNFSSSIIFCGTTHLIPDFEISEELPLNKTIEIALPIMKKGEYVFHCQMQMYKGFLVVE